MDKRQGLPGRELFISAWLVLVSFAVYWPVRHYDFVNHDDPVYVYENPHVLHGLSSEGVAWETYKAGIVWDVADGRNSLMQTTLGRA